MKFVQSWVFWTSSQHLYRVPRELLQHPPVLLVYIKIKTMGLIFTGYIDVHITKNRHMLRCVYCFNTFEKFSWTTPWYFQAMHLMTNFGSFIYICRRPLLREKKGLLLVNNLKPNAMVFFGNRVDHVNSCNHRLWVLGLIILYDSRNLITRNLHYTFVQTDKRAHTHTHMHKWYEMPLWISEYTCGLT